MSDAQVRMWLFVFSGISAATGLLCAVFAFLMWKKGREQPSSGATTTRARASWRLIGAAIFATVSCASLSIFLYLALHTYSLRMFFLSLTGPVILLALIWAAFIKFTKVPPPPKLVIHRAVYGAGQNLDVDVTESLRNRARDGMVIAVDNALVAKDPAYGVRKRLAVEYSYGDRVVRAAARSESMPWETVQLILPEDPELIQLRSEKGTPKQQSTANPSKGSEVLAKLPVYRQELEVNLSRICVGTTLGVSVTTVLIELKLWAKNDVNLIEIAANITVGDVKYETKPLQDLSEWILVEEVKEPYRNQKDTNLETLSLINEIEAGLFREGHHQPKWVGCEIPSPFLKETEISKVAIMFRDKHGIAKKETFRTLPNSPCKVIDVAFRG